MTSFGNPRPVYGSRGREIGQGAAASAFLFSVYRWMALGLAVTGATAWYVAHSEAAVQLIFGNRLAFFGLFLAQIAMVVAFTPVAVRSSAGAAAAMLLAYSALSGVTFSAIFLRYTAASVEQTFFVSAGAFAGLAFFGTTTKRDLTAVGRFMMMGLIGIIIASVVNFWLNSPAVYWVTTYAGVLVFAGLTAYDTQKLRDLYL